MIYIKNPAGYEFCWQDGSDLIEVFHKASCFPDEPIEVVVVENLRRSVSDLRKFADEPEYRRYHA